MERVLEQRGFLKLLEGLLILFLMLHSLRMLVLMTITGVRSRFPVIAAGIILIILGIIPKFAALVTLIPPAVLGGATVAIFWDNWS